MREQLHNLLIFSSEKRTCANILLFSQLDGYDMFKVSWEMKQIGTWLPLSPRNDMRDSLNAITIVFRSCAQEYIQIQ